MYIGLQSSTDWRLGEIARQRCKTMANYDFVVRWVYIGTTKVSKIHVYHTHTCHECTLVYNQIIGVSGNSLPEMQNNDQL